MGIQSIYDPFQAYNLALFNVNINIGTTRYTFDTNKKWTVRKNRASLPKFFLQNTAWSGKNEALCRQHANDNKKLI